MARLVNPMETMVRQATVVPVRGVTAVLTHNGWTVPCR